MATTNVNFTIPDFDGTDHGLVPAPVSGDESKALKGDGTWGTVINTISEDAGPGIGLVDSATAGAVVLKNAKDGQGTRVANNTGSFQTDVHFSAANLYHYSDALGEPLEGSITAAGRAILDDADASAQRATLGLGTAATQASTAFDAAGSAAAAQAAAILASAQRASNLSDLASASTARTNLGLGTAAQVNTGTGASDVPTITQADARYTAIGATDNFTLVPPPHPSIVAGLLWTNMPAALTFYFGQTRWIIPVDLTGKTSINLYASTVGGGTYAANAKIIIKYRTVAQGYDATPANWSTIGSTEVQTLVNAGVTITESGYIDLVAGAKARILIGIFGIDGDGAADPAINMVGISTK